MTFKVYLAGPIAGLNYDEANDWRLTAMRALDPRGVQTLSPLRAKGYLRGFGKLAATAPELGLVSPLSTARGIMTRDRWDCTRADVVLVNLLGAERVSIGTVMEIAWAHQARVPVVCVMEPDNVHEHCMVAEAIDFRVGTLAEALDLIIALKG